MGDGMDGGWIGASKHESCPNASSLLRAGTGAAERIFSRSVRISFVESEDHPEPDGVDGLHRDRYLFRTVR